jgi:hypothetical protein
VDGSTTVEGAADADFLFGMSNHDQMDTRDWLYKEPHF